MIRKRNFAPHSLFLLKGDRQIPVLSAGLAARSRDLAIPGKQTKNSLRM
jgi:hypothetical protein